MVSDNVKQITNRYLYNQAAKPVNLLDDLIIRDPNDIGNSYQVDISHFMTEGAGRFAIGRQFEIVNDFFTADSSVLPAGTYTKEEIANIFDYNFYGWEMYQWDYQDTTDDYAERVYIYNNMVFQIADGATFIVESDGRRRIENFAIVPMPEAPENFDFIGGGYIAGAGNLYLEPHIDPSKIGRVVPIVFSGMEDLSYITYDGNSYLNDLITMASWEDLDTIKLASDMNDLLDDLWHEGITKFLDSNNRPIFYGKSGNDILTEESFGVLDTPFLVDYINNGIVLLGGEGNDELTGASNSDYLMGGGGNDILKGGAQTDLLEGGSGIDHLWGDEGADTVKGGEGNDYVYGGSGNDQLIGAHGNDHLYADSDVDELWGGEGNDVLTFSATDVLVNAGGTAWGEEGNDVFYAGTIGSFNFYGGNGNDIFYAAVSPDSINFFNGGGGDDLYFINSTSIANLSDSGIGDRVNFDGAIVAGVARFDKDLFDENDEVYARDFILGRFTLRYSQDFPGDLGFFVTEGEGGFSFSNWSNGAFGISIPDDVQGTEGNDSIEGGSGHETIRSHGGNDTVDGGGGDDNIIGGEGNDSIDGGSGNDFISFTYASSGVSVNLALGTASVSGSDIDTIVNIEHIAGSSGADTIAGNNQANEIIGGGGNDRLTAKEGADTLEGGDGSDRFILTALLDSGTGTGNRDMVTDFDSSEGDRIDLSALGTFAFRGTSAFSGTNHEIRYAITGTDLVLEVDSDADGMADLELQLNGVASISSGAIIGIASAINNSGTSGNDTITGSILDDTLSGGDGNDSLNGGSGNDILSGDNHQDTLEGGSDNDTLNGGDGNDLLLGGPGADSINGGNGADTVSYAQSDAAVSVDLATGTFTGGHAEGDTVIGAEVIIGSDYGDTLIGDATANRFDGGSAADLLSGASGNDTLNGGDGADTVSGDEGSDVLAGGDGADVLSGGDDADSLAGDTGADSLSGGSGNDTLAGGAGVDTLHGGTGADIFRYLLASDSGTGSGNRDMVSDFSNTDGDRIDLSALGAFAYRGTSAFSGSIKQVRYAISGSDVIVQVDSNGDNAADFEMELTGVSSLARADFIGVSGDTVTGTTGAETLSGGEWDDTILADAGNDWVYGLGGNDSIAAGDGHDTLWGGAGADTIDGGNGSDAVGYTDSSAVMINLASGENTGGEAEGDVLIGIELVSGSAYGDSIVGDSGLNGLYGKGGNDTIDGGDGNDIVSGEDNNDSLLGGNGNDTLNGGEGSDTLVGGAGADSLVGGNGTDWVSYQGSTAVVINLTTGVNTGGHAAGDTISDVEIIVGSSGNDSITGSSANETFSGGVGADTIRGELGNDVISYEHSTAGVSVNLTITGAQSGGESGNDAVGDVLSGIELVFGSAYADTIIGDDNVNGLYGRGGNDLMSGGGQNDYVWGETGNDTLSGIYGTDNLNGGDGNDLMSGGDGADTLTGGTGVDTFKYLNLTEAGVGSGNRDIITDFSTGDGDQIDLTSLGRFAFLGTGAFVGGANQIRYYASGSDLIVAVDTNGDTTANFEIQLTGVGSIAASDFMGATISSIVLGGSGNDTLMGTSGDDVMLGNDGNDTFYGGLGADTINGGNGANAASYELSDAGVSVNLFDGSPEQYGHAAGDVLTNVGLVFGSAYNDTLIGDANVNGLYGRGGNDSISGGGNNDYVWGGGGDDTLSGVDGVDNLNGGDGNDWITGGTGADTITGGSGNDTIVYAATGESGTTAGQIDRITDFAQGSDLIDLSAFSGTFSFIGTTAFNGTANQIRYAQDAVNSKTVIYVNTNTDTTADMHIELSGLYTLTGSDFVL